MKVKIKNKRPLIAIAILLAVAGIGGTIAYHTSHGIFSNFFTTIFDQWTVTEEFVSPNNWQQCQRTPKTITASNSGNGAVGVRVKYEEYWKLANNNDTSHDSDLPLQIGGQNVALVNMNTSNDWELRDDGYYYYTRPLEPGETTSSVIDYVEYNCNANIVVENNDCETVNGVTTCTKRDQYDYDNANYHLFATVEITDEPETYGITATTTRLMSGADINIKMKTIANPGSSFANTGVVDTSIRAIKMADALPDNFEETWNNRFNDYSSDPRVSGWFDSSTGTFYFYTEADQILTNSSMGWAFQEMDALTDISGLANWHTSNTTAMNSLFNGCDNLADITPLTNWDTSNNTNLGWAFNEVPKITNLNALSNWNTKKVTSMSSIFYKDAAITNIDGLSSWDTSSVTSLGWAFYQIPNLTNLDALSHWDTKNVTTMQSIFYQNTSLSNIDGLAHWDTSNVTNMGWLLYEDSNITNLNALQYWNTSSVTAINSAFNGCTSLADISGLSKWDVKNVSNMGWLLNGTAAANLDALTNWQTDSLVYLDNAFKNMPNLQNIDGLENWKTGNVIALDSLFYGSPNVRSIDALADWDTKNLETMTWLLGPGGAERNPYISSLSPLRNWDVRKVTTIYAAFYGLTNISSLDGLQDWQTDSLREMQWAFANMGSKLTDISQIANWNVSNVTSVLRLFSGDSRANGSALNGWSIPSSVEQTYAFTGSDKPTWYQE